MLPDKETLTIEFKSDIKKLSDSEIFEAVVAFANTEGGDLYLGIENSGEVTGVNEEHKNSITVAATQNNPVNADPTDVLLPSSCCRMRPCPASAQASLPEYAPTPHCR